MKILLTIQDISATGGAERVVVNFANALNELGYEVEIMSFYQKNINLPYALDSSIKLWFKNNYTATQQSIQTPKKHFAHTRNAISRRLLNYKLNTMGYDIIIASDALFFPYFKNKHTKYIKICHESSRFGSRTKRDMMFDVFVILSAKEIDIWRKYHHNIKVIPNFLPQIPQKSTDYTQKVVLSVGRFSSEKGFLRLIDIWKMVQESIKNPPHSVILSETQCSEVSKSRKFNKNSESMIDKRIDKLDSYSQHCDLGDSTPCDLDSSLRASHSAQNDKNNSPSLAEGARGWVDLQNLADWKLIIVGDGILKSEIQAKINALNLQDSIILKPFTKDIEREYLGASIYAMSSHFEGFPMVLVEVSSYALPCIAFDVATGPSDIIAHNKSGYLVSDNDLEGYAKHLIKLMSNENLRTAFGGEAKRLVSEKFSKEVVIQKWQELLENKP